MKAYTDIEQSKKLAEILPMESADMYWLNRHIDLTETKYEVFVIDKSNKHIDFFKSYAVAVDNNEIIPCWSLAALLGVLPTTIGDFFEKNALRLRMDKGENDFNIWYENFDCGDVAEGLDVREDNPVDACYEMILKLHEQKRL